MLRSSMISSVNVTAVKGLLYDCGDAIGGRRKGQPRIVRNGAAFRHDFSASQIAGNTLGLERIGDIGAPW